MTTWSPEMLARALVTPPPPHGPATPKGRPCIYSPSLPSANSNFSGLKLRLLSTKSPIYRRSSRGNSNLVWNCLIPVVGGGFWEEDSGAGDDYVSTRGRKFNKEFNVLAKMLKQIEPLDTSVIGKGASQTSKEAMKRTISSMLGVLPSDRFQELRDHKRRQVCIEAGEDNNNSLLAYLRSLEPDMVTQLSHPSSAEVEIVSQQLVQNVLKIFFPDDISSNIEFGDADSIKKDGNLAEIACSWSPSQEVVPASRDYLARLLFWCMLLGHHMRGLEYRLQLSCAVGIA